MKCRAWLAVVLLGLGCGIGAAALIRSNAELPKTRPTTHLPRDQTIQNVNEPPEDQGRGPHSESLLPNYRMKPKDAPVEPLTGSKSPDSESLAATGRRPN